MSPRRDAAHAAFEELAVGYALHALEPDEELRFEAHLQTCAACRDAVREHQDTLAGLAATAPAAEPPPAVLDGIRAAVRAEPRGRPLPDDVAAVAPVVPLREARRRRELRVRREWVFGAAAAATAVVLGLGAWVAVLQGQRDDEAARGDRLAQAVEALERRDARTVQLADFDGEVQAVVVAHGAQMSLVVDGLEPNPEGTVYVLWGQHRSGAVRALSAFDVDEEGLDVLHGMPLQVPVEELTALMVTHEHGRTPPEQTEQPVLVAGEV